MESTNYFGPALDPTGPALYWGWACNPLPVIPRYILGMGLPSETVGKGPACFWPWQEPLFPAALPSALPEVPAVSVITRLALRMFSGLSFTVTVSLYSGTRSLSSGRFTYTMPLYREKQGRKHPMGCEECFP